MSKNGRLGSARSASGLNQSHRKDRLRCDARGREPGRAEIGNWLIAIPKSSRNTERSIPISALGY
jgi:hypothetical protein